MCPKGFTLVERFLITDINNPAASAKAQSDCPVVFDLVSATMDGGAEFNHIPGGANVLYLDGHVVRACFRPTPVSPPSFQ